MIGIQDDNSHPEIFKDPSKKFNQRVINPNGKIFAIDKATGGVVALDRPSDFSSRVHTRYVPNVPATPGAQVAQVPAVLVTPTVPVAPEVPTNEATLFENLKLRGLRTLKGEERATYLRLLSIYGKK